MSGHGSKFTTKMELAVVALLTQRNVEEAARSVGISTATLMRWQKKPEFQKAVKQSHRDAYNQSIGRLQQASSAAATTLLKAMADPNKPPAVKVRAAGLTLSLSARAIEMVDMEQRLAELERASETSRIK